jgi:uncharacterized protein YndB with AHSA1/START domain
MNTNLIKVEKTFNVPIYRIWKALTDETEIKKWYFDIPGFKAEAGFEFHFYGGVEDRQYLHKCRILEVIRDRKIAYSWRYDGYDGDSTVTFELAAEEGNTALTLTHEGIETFPQDNPDFERRNFETGWNEIIHGALAQYLGKDAVISMGQD